MKKLLICVITLLLVFAPFASYGFSDKEVTREYLSDGSYYETVLEDAPSFSLMSSNQKTVTKSKTCSYKNASDTTMWYVKVTGTFKYGNGSSSCTSSTVSAGSNNSHWKVSNKSASKSGNKAIAKATGKQYSSAGTLLTTVTRTVTLTCNSSGNIT